MIMMIMMKLLTTRRVASELEPVPMQASPIVQARIGDG